MWNLLRARRLFDLKFRRQEAIGPYIVDFYCAACRVAVELDGGQHFTADGRSCDEKRTEQLGRRGVRIIRFSNREVIEELDGVLDRIRWACGK